MIFLYLIICIFCNIGGSTVWDSIPTEITTNIFSSLDYKVLKNLAMVNKNFKNHIEEKFEDFFFIKDYMTLIKNYDHLSYGTQCYDQNLVIQKIEKNVDNIKSTSAIQFCPKNNRKLFYGLFFSFCEKMPNLKEITFQTTYKDFKCFDIKLLSLLNKTTVEKITFSGINSKQFLEIDFSKLPTLKKININYFKISKKISNQYNYFFPMIEKLNNSSVESFSIKLDTEKKKEFLQNCFFYLLKHGKIHKSLQKYISDYIIKSSSSTADIKTIYDIIIQNDFFHFNIQQIRKYNDETRKIIVIFNNNNIDYQSIIDILKDNILLPVTLYLYSLSLSTLFEKLQETNKHETINQLTQKIDEVYICINPFSDTKVYIQPSDFYNFNHKIILHIQDQIGSEKITIDTSGNYKNKNIERMYFNNSKYFLLSKKLFEKTSIIGPCSNKMYHPNLDYLCDTLTAFCDQESLLFSLKTVCLGGGSGGYEWESDEYINDTLKEFFDEYFKNIINFDEYKEKKIKKIKKIKKKLNNNLTRWDIDKEKRKKNEILIALQKIFDTPLSDLNEKQKQYLLITNKTLWDTYRMLIAEELAPLTKKIKKALWDAYLAPLTKKIKKTKHNSDIAKDNQIDSENNSLNTNVQSYKIPLFFTIGILLGTGGFILYYYLIHILKLKSITDKTETQH